MFPYWKGESLLGNVKPRSPLFPSPLLPPPPLPTSIFSPYFPSSRFPDTLGYHDRQ
jgi:hypothetical protein